MLVELELSDEANCLSQSYPSDWPQCASQSRPRSLCRDTSWRRRCWWGCEGGRPLGKEEEVYVRARTGRGFCLWHRGPWLQLCTHRSGTSGRRLLWSRCQPGPAPGPPPELWGERLVCWPPPPPLCPRLGKPWWPVPLSWGQVGTKSVKMDYSANFRIWCIGILQFRMTLIHSSPVGKMLKYLEVILLLEPHPPPPKVTSHCQVRCRLLPNPSVGTSDEHRLALQSGCGLTHSSGGIFPVPHTHNNDGDNHNSGC